MIDAPPRDLTPGEERSLERIADLRGLCGRQRIALQRQADRIAQLEALLRDLRDHTAPLSSASEMIEQGLANWPEEA
jgi:hypothetical protein